MEVQALTTYEAEQNRIAGNTASGCPHDKMNSVSRTLGPQAPVSRGREEG